MLRQILEILGDFPLFHAWVLQELQGANQGTMEQYDIANFPLDVKASLMFIFRMVMF